MRFRKKPVEAVRWDGNNYEEVRVLFGGWDRFMIDRAGNVRIDTPNGQRTAFPGDWIVEDGSGGFYPVKPDIFESSYEPVDAVRSGPTTAELRELLADFQRNVARVGIALEQLAYPAVTVTVTAEDAG